MLCERAAEPETKEIIDVFLWDRPGLIIHQLRLQIAATVAANSSGGMSCGTVMSGMAVARDTTLINCANGAAGG